MNERLQRSEATAADAVLAFYKQRLASEDHTFTADQLRFYVQNNIVGKTSPSTPDRVLRNLRIKGQLDYVVMNRGLSLYKAIPVQGIAVSAVPAKEVWEVRRLEQGGWLDTFDTEEVG